MLKIKAFYGITIAALIVFASPESVFSQDIERPVKSGLKTLEMKHAFELEDCIAIAMQNSFQIRIAEKQLKLARVQLMKAMRDLGPEVKFLVEDSQGKVNRVLYTGRKLQAMGRQPIFRGGELIYTLQQKRLALDVVKQDYERIKNDLTLEVKEAYYSLDKTQKNIKIQKKLDKEVTKFQDIVKAGYKADAVSQIDFLKVSAHKNQADFNLESATENMFVANLMLQQTMNIEDEIAIRAVKEPRVIEIDLDTCYTLAYMNRPELKIAYLREGFFRYGDKIKKAKAFAPKFDILGMYGNMREDWVPNDRQDADVIPVFPTATGRNDPRGLGPEYYLGFEATMPFWGNTVKCTLIEEEWQPVVSAWQGTQSRTSTITFGILDALTDIEGLSEGEVEYIKSQNEMNKKKQEVTLEVKEVYFKYKKAILLMKLAKSKVKYQEKEVALLEIRRELGEALYSDVTEELLKLAEEQYLCVQAIADYYTAIASLNKAVGIEGYFEN
ncbi:MAG: TolC family protein [Candidatus Omnitrophica bacterium]|nr:TolC family protein [Candidatus Omnitrophota bacterium]